MADEGPWSDFTSAPAAEKQQGDGPWADFAPAKTKTAESTGGEGGILSLPSDIGELGARGINAAVQTVSGFLPESLGAEPRKPQPYSWQKSAGEPSLSLEALGHGVAGTAKKLAEPVISGATLPGDVYAGKVDPLSNEGIKRATELGALTVGVNPSAATGTTKGIAAVTEPKPSLYARTTGRTPENIARSDLERAITRDAATPEELSTKLMEAQAIRPEAGLADVAGENVRGLVERIGQSPGEGRGIVVPRLTERQQQQMNRVVNDITDLTGTKRTAVQALNETMTSREVTAAPLYKQAMIDGDKEVWSPTLEQLSASPTVREAMQGAVRTWRDNAVADGYGAMNPGAIVDRGGILSFPAGSVPVFPNLQFWNYTKRILDDAVGEALRSGQNTKARTLSSLTKTLRQELDGVVPSYKAARDAWAGPSAYMDSIQQGRNILKTKMSAEEMRSEFGALTESEKEGFRTGAVSAIRGKMGNNPAKLADMTRILRSPEMREKVAMMMPTPEAAQSWLQRLDYEIGSSEVTGRALKGSATARRMAEAQDAENLVGDLVLGALGHPTAAVKHIAFRAATEFPARMHRLMRAKSDEHLAEMLTGPGALGALQRIGKPALPSTPKPVIRRPPPPRMAPPSPALATALRTANAAVRGAPVQGLAHQATPVVAQRSSQERKPRPPTARGTFWGYRKRGGLVNHYDEGGVADDGHGGFDAPWQEAAVQQGLAGDSSALILASIAQQSGASAVADAPPGSLGDTSAPLLARIAAMEGQTGTGDDKPQDLQIVGGIPYAQDPEGYGFGPFYSPSSVNYEDTNRGPPLAPPLWSSGQEGTPPEGAFIQDKPGAWMEYYTPNDRSTGGGFFLAGDADADSYSFQEGAFSPSTNNWRLIGSTPGHVMRNGRIIDLNATDMRGPPLPAEGLGGNYGGPRWNLGTGAGMGYPAGYSAGFTQSFGWPGQQAPWASGTYWTGKRGGTVK